MLNRNSPPASVDVSEISEIEEPEGFRLTGKEVWAASTTKDENELNAALGLTELKLNISASVSEALREEASKRGIILKALIRQILTDHVANHA